MRPVRLRTRPQKPDGRYFLLRACRERPRRRAAEQLDELASFELTELHSLPLASRDQASMLNSHFVCYAPQRK